MRCSRAAATTGSVGRRAARRGRGAALAAMRPVATLNTWLVERVRRRARPLPTRVGHCANCGAPVDGAFCARCGQETAIELPTARQFLRDAAGRYVALDGRLWRTLAALCARPGLLTREYLAGRRRRYVRPGRLFLVLSLALFAVLRPARPRR